MTGALLDAPDATTGLVYLGQGRYYDPALGRPLQPNSVGGPPTLPPGNPSTPTPPNTPTPPPTDMPTPPTPPTPSPPTPLPPLSNLSFTNPFGAGKKYFIVAYYGYHENSEGKPIGFQTDLGGGQGQGHPGVDMITLDYALESKRNGYIPSPNHRELFSPVSGTISKEPSDHKITILVKVAEGNVMVRLVHVDSNEAPPDGSAVEAGQPLNMTFKGRGHGTGSDYPHLHLELFRNIQDSRVYSDPLPKLPSADSAGYYWNYVDEEGTSFTQLPGPGV